jgi:hypothetical protein
VVFEDEAVQFLEGEAGAGVEGAHGGGEIGGVVGVVVGAAVGAGAAGEGEDAQEQGRGAGGGGDDRPGGGAEAEAEDEIVPGGVGLGDAVGARVAARAARGPFGELVAPGIVMLGAAQLVGALGREDLRASAPEGNWSRPRLAIQRGASPDAGDR